MAVKNIECQIAEMQIGRFVSGETLSDEALLQLDAHIAKCASCARVLADRRTALRAMLHEGYAAVTTDVPTHRKENLLIQALREKAKADATRAVQSAAAEASPQSADSFKKWNIDSLARLTRDSLRGAETSQAGGRVQKPAPNSTKNFTKPLLYLTALFVVLIAMSYLTHGQNSLLGQPASGAFPANPPTSSSTRKMLAPVSTTPKPAPNLAASRALPGVLKAHLAAPHSTNLQSRPIKAEKSPAPAPSRLRLRGHHPSAISHKRAANHRSIPTNRITIYGDDGTPLAG